MGRSGSGVIHAFLDSHPELLHVPHTFRFFDFPAAHPDILDRPVAEIARTYANWQNIRLLFESRESVIIGGRLGPEMGTYVSIDRDTFADVCANLLEGHTLDWRTVFTAIVATFGWCAGQDLDRVKSILHHLHHGDWLLPEACIERSNLVGELRVPAREMLKPKGFLASMRDPAATCASYIRFCRKLNCEPIQQIDYGEGYLRLLAQDWMRLVWMKSSGDTITVIRIEDIRKDAQGTMSRCADALGIARDARELERMTYYGLEWHGDIYTPPSNVPRSAEAGVELCWQDRSYLDALLGSAPGDYGYHVGPLQRAWLLLLVSLVWPSPVLDDGVGSWFARRRRMVRRAWNRVQFARALARQLRSMTRLRAHS